MMTLVYVELFHMLNVLYECLQAMSHRQHRKSLNDFFFCLVVVKHADSPSDIVHLQFITQT